jgi:hypothetical protein
MTRVTWDRCYDFLNFFAEKFSDKNWRFLLKLLLVFAKIVIITLVFEKKRQFFHRKLGKIAENCVHNIDPRLGDFSPIRRFFSLATLLKIT